MKEHIIQAIHNTFPQKADASLRDLNRQRNVQDIVGLSKLIDILADESKTQKTAMEALSLVYMELDSKDKPSKLEQKLLQEIQSEVYAKRNVSDNSAYKY